MPERELPEWAMDMAGDVLAQIPTKTPHWETIKDCPFCTAVARALVAVREQAADTVQGEGPDGLADGIRALPAPEPR